MDAERAIGDRCRIYHTEVFMRDVVYRELFAASAKPASKSRGGKRSRSRAHSKQTDAAPVPGFGKMLSMLGLASADLSKSRGRSFTLR